MNDTGLAAVILGVVVGHLRASGASLADIQAAVAEASKGYDGMAKGDPTAWKAFSSEVEQAIVKGEPT